MSETLEHDAPTADTPESSPADDLRSALGAAFDEHSEPDTSRDDRGRFATHERETKPVVSHETPVDDTQAAETAEPPALEPPATLSADDLSRWATLPRDAQEFIAQREAKAGEVARTLEPVQTVLKQYEPLYAARGVSASQALASLFEAQRMLETRPVEAIAVLARQYGVQFPQADAGNPNQPDQITALLHEVQSLKAEIAQGKQAAEHSAHQTIDQTIREFAANPEHRHFPTVRTYMGALMQADPKLDMAAAYQMACRAHPDISKAIAAEADKTAVAARAKAANEAKGKAVSLRGAPPVAGISQVPDNVRGVLSAAWDGALH